MKYSVEIIDHHAGLIQAVHDGVPYTQQAHTEQLINQRAEAGLRLVTMTFDGLTQTTRIVFARKERRERKHGKT